MTIEEKARAYDEAIKKLRDFYRDYDTISCLINVKEELANLFPELAESEDERTRKDIIRFVQSRLAGFPECERFVTWLEKQGEFDDNIITREDEILQAISIGLTDVAEDVGWSDFGGLPIEEIQKWLEKQGEKSVWTDKDEELLQHCCGAIHAADYYTFEDKDEMEQWLKTLKQRML